MASLLLGADAERADGSRPDGGIAIAVLTYNRVHLLRKCVENVLARTSPRTAEIVIWNNGSEDGTREYLDGLTDRRITVVHHETNIGQNAYARAFELTSAEYLVDLDDDVVDAPSAWDTALLEAFRRLPTIGFLAADLEDDPHDPASHHRHHVYEYTTVDTNGVRLLKGPTGGACTITARALYDRVGGFRQRRKEIFFLEDEGYVLDIRKLGYESAVFADLRVRHNGGPHYGAELPQKLEFWRRRNRMIARKESIKRVLFRLPFFRRVNARFGWCIPPS